MINKREKLIFNGSGFNSGLIVALLSVFADQPNLVLTITWTNQWRSRISQTGDANIQGWSNANLLFRIG